MRSHKKKEKKEKMFIQIIKHFIIIIIIIIIIITIIIIIIIIIKTRLAMQGREREIDTLSVRRPQPHIPTNRGKEEKGKIVEDKKGESN